MMAIFLGPLDQTIVAVSMPAISARFHDVNLLAWVISGYMVAMTVAVPIYGKLGDLYGHKRILLVSTVLTAGASWWLVVAGDFWSFLAAWALQGFYVVRRWSSEGAEQTAKFIDHELVAWSEIETAARALAARCAEKKS